MSISYEALLKEVEHNLWKPTPKPGEHYCKAANAYMSLLLGHREARGLLDPDVWGELTSRRANDIFRACRVEPAPVSDPGVHRALLKALGGYPLAPVMVVSWDNSAGAELADGRHRTSLAYAIDPFAEVPCFVARLGKP